MEIVTPQERQMYDASHGPDGDVTASDDRDKGSKAESSKADKDDSDDDSDDTPETPEQMFEDRYPQPVHVSDLVGKPMIQTDNTPIGTIRYVARTQAGNLAIIVPYGGFLGFGRRLVAVAAVLLLARLARQSSRSTCTWTTTPRRRPGAPARMRSWRSTLRCASRSAGTEIAAAPRYFRGSSSPINSARPPRGSPVAPGCCREKRGSRARSVGARSGRDKGGCPGCGCFT